MLPFFARADSVVYNILNLLGRSLRKAPVPATIALNVLQERFYVYRDDPARF